MTVVCHPVVQKRNDKKTSRGRERERVRETELKRNNSNNDINERKINK